MGETERVYETGNGRDKTETCVTEREKGGEKTCGERERKEELSLIVLYSCMCVK